MANKRPIALELRAGAFLFHIITYNGETEIWLDSLEICDGLNLGTGDSMSAAMGDAIAELGNIIGAIEGSVRRPDSWQVIDATPSCPECGSSENVTRSGPVWICSTCNARWTDDAGRD
jgi:hypothetical protein